MLYIYIYIYDISCLKVNDLTLILLTWRKWWANNASKQQMGFNSGFKGLNTIANDDFYNGIQKLYDSANLCVQLEGMYVEN